MWPLLVLATFWLARRLRVRGPRLLAAVIVGGVAASTIAMMLLYSVSTPSRAYFGTDARASSLLIGAGLALLVLRRPEWLSSRRGRAFARWAALPAALDRAERLRAIHRRQHLLLPRRRAHLLRGGCGGDLRIRGRAARADGPGAVHPPAALDRKDLLRPVPLVLAGAAVVGPLAAERRAPTQGAPTRDHLRRGRDVLLRRRGAHPLRALARPGAYRVGGWLRDGDRRRRSSHSRACD